MTLAQREHPEAVAEFDAAVRWYEEQEAGIGLALIDRAEQARKEIDHWPDAAPPFGPPATAPRSAARLFADTRTASSTQLSPTRSWSSPTPTSAANPVTGSTG
jgi:hypothetical protein